jgi:predicted transposase YdaD
MRIFIMHDILKDTWVFQEIIKEGLEQGLEQGKKAGIEEGKQQVLERVLVQFVEIRFPTLLPLAKWAVEQKMSLEQLEKKLNTLYRVNTTEEAMAVLLANEK